MWMATLRLFEITDLLVPIVLAAMVASLVIAALIALVLFNFAPVTLVGFDIGVEVVRDEI